MYAKTENDVNVKGAIEVIEETVDTIGKEILHSHHATDMSEIILLLSQQSRGIDIMEVCGGEARVTQVAFRRHLKTGKNFDLVAGLDLTDKKTIEELWQYVKQYKPLVIVMAPVCTSFGSLSHLNKVINPVSWMKSRKIGGRIASLCAQLALWQVEHGNHFINEQPYPSSMYEVHP